MSTVCSTCPALSTNFDSADNDVPTDTTSAIASVHYDDDVVDVPDNSDELANTDDGSKAAQDPHAYIERSLRYADLCLCRDHAVARVQHLMKFEQSMPLSKRPSNGKNGGCLALFQDKVEKAQDRVDKFRDEYASKRAIAKTKRTERIARDKLAKSHQDSLGKPMLEDLSKRFKIAKILATKAAAEALRSLDADATKEAKKEVAEKAFSAAAASALKSDAKLPDMKTLAEMAAAENSDMEDA